MARNDTYRPCFVYLMEDLSNGQIKIGVSINPNQRRHEIQDEQRPKIAVRYGFLFETEIAAYSAEQELHKRFRKFNVTLEWFDLDLEKTRTEIAAMFPDVECTTFNLKAQRLSETEIEEVRKRRQEQIDRIREAKQRYGQERYDHAEKHARRAGQNAFDRFVAVAIPLAELPARLAPEGTPHYVIEERQRQIIEAVVEMADAIRTEVIRVNLMQMRRSPFAIRGVRKSD